MARTTATQRQAVFNTPYSLTMNGATGYAIDGDHFDKERTDAFSVSMWLRFSGSLAGFQYLVTKYLSTGTLRGWGLLASGGVPEFSFLSDVGTNNYLDVGMSTALKSGQWYHLVLTYSGSSLASGVKFYVNGAQVANGTTFKDTLSGTTVGGGANLVFGSWGNGTRVLNGNLTKVRIHNVALTAAQVLSLFLTDAVASVEGSWQMTDGSGTTLTADVGGFNATITTPVWSSSIVPRPPRTAASARQVILPFTKSWSFNGTSSGGSNAGIDFSAKNKIVVDAFVRLGANGANGVLAELTTNTNSFTDGFVLSQATTNKITANYKDGSGYCSWTSATVPLNTWVHVLVVLDKTLSNTTGVKIYINGVLSGANDIATAATGGFFGNRPFYVGARAGTSIFFSGLMKNLRVHSFTGTFGASDAIAILQSTAPSNFTLLDKWVGEESGSTATDTGSNLKDLTLSNVAYSTDAPCKARATAS